MLVRKERLADRLVVAFLWVSVQFLSIRFLNLTNQHGYFTQQFMARQWQYFSTHPCNPSCWLNVAVLVFPHLVGRFLTCLAHDQKHTDSIRNDSAGNAMP